MNPPQPTDALQQFRRRQASRYASGECSVLVGVSPTIVRVRTQIDAAVASRCNVLVTGIDSSALVQIAEAIHYRTHPDGQAALWRIETEQALPSELGRALGSLLREPQPGTLLIESIEQLPAEQQVELLTAMGSRDWNASVLVTCPPPDDSPAGMSDELAAAVSTLAIELPALSERPEDIPPLVDWHIERLNQQSAEAIAGVQPDALDLLMIYPWPGELLELSEVLTSAHRRAKGSHIAPSDLPKTLHHAMEHAAMAAEPPEPIDLDDYLSRVEAALVERALELAGGNKAEAARLLGVSRPRLYRKLVQMGLAEPAPSDQKPRAKPTPADQLPPTAADLGSDEDTDIEFLPVDGEGE